MLSWLNLFLRAAGIFGGKWQRKQLVHGVDIQNPSRSATSIAAITINYALAGKKHIVLNNNWKKPSEGFLVINVDASYNAAMGSGSTGAVIRDATGGFIAAAHSYIPQVVDAAMPEAFALRDGLLLAQQIGCSRVEILANCLEVVTR